MSARAAPTSQARQPAVYFIYGRIPLSVLFSASFAAAYYDWISHPSFASEWSTRPELWVEALARIGMCAVGAFLALTGQKTREQQRLATLLAWSLLGSSLDLFWQELPEGRIQWLAMLVKYAGVSFSLGALLKLTACFREAGCTGIRGILRRISWWAAAAMFAAGVFHGVTYIDICQEACNPASLPALAYYAYLLIDAALRLAIILAVVVGFVEAPRSERPRQLLIAISCLFFTFGTVANFLTRFPYLEDKFGDALSIIDSVTTLIFPIGLAIAARRRELFSIDWVVDRALLAGTYCAVFLIAFKGVEYAGHELFSERLGALNAVVAGLIAWVLKPFEEKANHALVNFVLPDRASRFRLLRKLGEGIALVENRHSLEDQVMGTIKKATDATFAAAFTRNDSDQYELAMPRFHKNQTLPSLTQIACVPQKTNNEFDDLRRGHDLRRERAGKVVPEADLVLPMLIAGKLFGFFALGPKQSEMPHYDPAEIRELSIVARDVGAAMFALDSAWART